MILKSRNRKENHVSIIVEANEEEFKEIRDQIRKALHKCPAKPSFCITRVDFRE